MPLIMSVDPLLADMLLTPDDDTGDCGIGCLGLEVKLKGPPNIPCDPDFKRGKPHLQHKFCPSCRPGFAVPGECLRAIPDELQDCPQQHHTRRLLVGNPAGRRVCAIPCDQPAQQAVPRRAVDLLQWNPTRRAAAGRGLATAPRRHRAAHWRGLAARGLRNTLPDLCVGSCEPSAENAPVGDHEAGLEACLGGAVRE